MFEFHGWAVVRSRLDIDGSRRSDDQDLSDEEFEERLKLLEASARYDRPTRAPAPEPNRDPLRALLAVSISVVGFVTSVVLILSSESSAISNPSLSSTRATAAILVVLVVSLALWFLHARNRRSDRLRPMRVLTCPRCNGTDLYYEAGLVTGQKYHCKRCGYIGAFVIQREVEAPD